MFNKKNQFNILKEKNMKLRLLFTIAMTPILVMAGTVMAATSTVTTSTNDGAGGTSFGHSLTIFGCSAVVGAATACPTMSAAQATTFVFNTTGGSGVGLTNGMPTQVSYSSGIGEYLPNTADSTTGYLLDANLYGMCGVAGCPKFVPQVAVSTAVGITAQLLIADGGGTPAQGGTIPVGVSEFALQGTFTSQLLSGFTESALNPTPNFLNQLDIYHLHISQNGAGDFIDQRLAQQVNSLAVGSTPNGVLTQAFVYAGGAAGSTAETGTYDPTWIGNIDPFTQNPYNCNNVPAGATAPACGPYLNTGVIAQQVGDNMAGNTNGVDIGSYGQIFNNDLTGVYSPTNVPLAPNAPTGAYTPSVGPVVPATLP
jgi:hypothetical protein